VSEALYLTFDETQYEIKGPRSLQDAICRLANSCTFYSTPGDEWRSAWEWAGRLSVDDVKALIAMHAEGEFPFEPLVAQ
jgi:hypothetical protein